MDATNNKTNGDNKMTKTNMISSDCSKCKNFLFGSCSFDIEADMLEDNGSCFDLKTENITIEEDGDAEFIARTWTAYKEKN